MTMLRRIGILIVALLALACIEADAWAGKVGPEFRVSTYRRGDQYEPSVGALTGGGYVAVWTSSAQDGSSSGIYGQRFSPAGGRLGSEFRVNTTTVGVQYFPSVAGLRNGGFVVTWISQDQVDETLAHIYGQLYNAAGTPVGGEFLISAATETTRSHQYLSLAGLSGGGFVVVWGYDFGDDIFGQRYDEAGTPIAGRFRANTYRTINKDTPAVAGLRDGGFVVTWTTADLQDGSGAGIFGQRFGAGGARAGAEFRVNTTTSGEQNSASVAGLSRGGYVVAWISENEAAVFCQRYNAAGQRVGGEFRANNAPIHQKQPSIAGLANGGFVVTWQKVHQGYFDYYAQVFRSDGVRVGTWFRVNTRQHYTKSGERSGEKSAVRLIKGGYVVVWEFFGADTPDFGVFGQRFSQ